MEKQSRRHGAFCLQVKEASVTPEKRVVARPGVPAPTRLSAFVFADRPSPPSRDPDRDGHYVFELGENLSSRCALLDCRSIFGKTLLSDSRLGRLWNMCVCAPQESSRCVLQWYSSMDVGFKG